MLHPLAAEIALLALSQSKEICKEIGVESFVSTEHIWCLIHLTSLERG